MEEMGKQSSSKALNQVATATKMTKCFHPPAKKSHVEVLSKIKFYKLSYYISVTIIELCAIIMLTHFFLGATKRKNLRISFSLL